MHKTLLTLSLLFSFFSIIKAESGWFHVGPEYPWVWSNSANAWNYVFVPAEGLEIQLNGEGDSLTFPFLETDWVYVNSEFPWMWSSADISLMLANQPQGLVWTYNTANDQVELWGHSLEGSKIVEKLAELRVEFGLTAVVAGVWSGIDEVVTAAVGETVTDFPAEKTMLYRVGGVCINMLITVMLQGVDNGDFALDDTIDQWLPDLVNADKVTLRMLANCTAGYDDYVFTKAFDDAFFANVFRGFTADELIDFGMAHSPTYEPGTDWHYSHTTFVVIGKILSMVYNKPVSQLLEEQVFEPLGLTNTYYVTGPEFPGQPLHGFTTEREIFEDSTFWNPSWTSYTGSVVSSAIDVSRFARAWGTGELISQSSFEQMIAPTTVGIGPNTASRYYALGMGVVGDGEWLLQNPNFGGYQGAMAYNLEDGTTIVVSCTLGQNSDFTVHHGMEIYNALVELLGSDG
ncbi:serine hydrolase domain-containing protein [Rubellicoccus peritrichatus]|uniref:Serine hydrolase domain-containing protein n=1 Tax=Rubellicoccus peritrichatus TaxID=3080537 RepID=A0AAQ3QW85_9BACT|nr:serine hydrolase domain-containing protein [Puniceicoccus sp. CR14]WOO41627.1 serine hydrolase domain-containing protein [Puniceicoccus sp. CR14]